LNKYIWRWEEANEWLSIYDAFLSHRLARSNSEILEVGTWKGGWAISMAENDRSRFVTCVDPYPNLEAVKINFLENVELYAPGQVVLFANLDTAVGKPKKKFGVVHIDGEHSQDAVTRDLKLCISQLADDGLLVVDDFFYHSFPGVTAAIFSALEKNDLSPFLFTEKKLYICRTKFYEDYYSKAKDVMLKHEIQFEEDQRITLEKSSYIQSSSINGFNVLIFPTGIKVTTNFLRTIGVHRNLSLKLLLREILPPVTITVYKKLKNHFWSK
jgi:hypothetical protein